MKNYLVADRYANALCQTIEDPTRLERALSNLQDVAELLENHHDFRSCLCNDSLDVDLRARVLDDVLRRLGAEESVLRLCHLLLARDRITLIDDIADEVARMLDERLNRVTANVTTATTLTADQETRLCESLTRYSGKTVRMKTQVDPAIIGGVIARIGGEVLDGSLQTRLNHIRDALIAEEL